MRKSTQPLLIFAPGLLALLVAGWLIWQQLADDSWLGEFPVDAADLSATGHNPFFILEPGFQQVLAGGAEQLVITVLDETRMVAGVETRVIEERETKDGKLVEVSRNYFAISKRTKDVYYFGEEVDTYRDGEVVDHEGMWLAGVSGARFGLIMPGQPSLNFKHYQEIAPRVALDRAEIISLDETVRTPAGEFTSCLRVQETSPLEPGISEYKYYARGIGLVQDGPLKLVTYGKVEQS